LIGAIKCWGYVGDQIFGTKGASVGKQKGLLVSKKDEEGGAKGETT
jgi:hypothetical protein